MLYTRGRRHNGGAATMSNSTASIDYDAGRHVAYPYPVFATGSQIDVSVPPPCFVMTAQRASTAKGGFMNSSFQNRWRPDGEHDVKSFCCVPTGCVRYLNEPIDPADPGNAVRVTCSNPGCAVGCWMHGDCFEQWDRQADNLFRFQQARGCGMEDSAARLMLAGRARMCICGRGFVSADPTYPLLFHTPSIIGERSAVTHTADKQSSLDSVKSSLNGLFQQQLIQHQLEPQRIRSGSFSSTGSGSHCSSASSAAGHGVRVGYGNRSGSAGSSSSTPPLSPPRPLATSAFFPNACVGHVDSVMACSPDTLSVLPTVLAGSQSAAYRLNGSGVPRRNDSGCSTGSRGSYGSTGSLVVGEQTDPKATTASSTSHHQPEPSARGNIFQHRSDLSLYRIIRTAQRNSFNIRLDDEGPHGNDDIRSFLMRRLTTARVAAFQCVSCRCHMPVYDEFPLVDGTLFLSPRSYGVSNDGETGSTARLSVPIVRDRRMMNLHAVCLACLGAAVPADDGPKPTAADGGGSGATEVDRHQKRTIRCKFCQSPWTIGPTLILGTMYSYDVFASEQCCAARKACRRCGNQPNCLSGSTSVTSEPRHFSDFSRLSACLHCGLEDYHHVRTFDEALNCEFDNGR